MNDKIQNNESMLNNKDKNLNEIYISIIHDYEKYIYNYMDKIPILENYLIFSIEDLNNIYNENNNYLYYKFNYDVSRLLITYQKDIKYKNKISLLNKLNIVNYFKNKYIYDDFKYYNLNTNNLKYFLRKKSLLNSNINKKYLILKSYFINIVTTNNSQFTDNYYKLIKNAYLGFKYLNNLKNYFPTFAYTYCLMKCTKIEIDNTNDYQNWCNKTDDTNSLVSYIITESTKSVDDSKIYYIDDFMEKQNNEDIKNLIKMQINSIKNFININFKDNIEKTEILDNFIINDIYIKELDIEFKFPYYDDNINTSNFFNTKYIIFIPIISNNNINKNLYNFLNDEKYEINNVKYIYNDNSHNLNYNDLNKYRYNLESINNAILIEKKNENSNNTYISKFINFLNNSKKYDDSDTINSLDYKLDKFVSYYCLNDLKYINKEELEHVFIKFIDNKLINFNKILIKIKDDEIIKLYNKYVKFIDILVKAKCINYKKKLYDIFEIKMELAKHIYNCNEKFIKSNVKDDMIYTIEKSYNDLPNSNYFLNFLSQTSLIDIIINTYIYFLFFYTVFILYVYYTIYINNVNIVIFNKILIVIKNGIYFIFNLIKSNTNFINNFYVKLYEYGFFNILSEYKNFIFIIPIVYKILDIYSDVKNNKIVNIYNITINNIDTFLLKDKFLRFKIKNLLSYNFPSMIKFLWNNNINNVDNYIKINNLDINDISNKSLYILINDIKLRNQISKLKLYKYKK